MKQSSPMERSMNPVIWLILWQRYCGYRHSDIDWVGMRRAYDYVEEYVDDEK